MRRKNACFYIYNFCYISDSFIYNESVHLVPFFFFLGENRPLISALWKANQEDPADLNIKY